MKHFILTILPFFAVLTVATAQTPFYLQFEPGCINQLEYQFTYSGQNLLMYSVPKGENELYFFVIGKQEPATSSKLPNGAVSCQSNEVNATLIDNINAGGRLAYIVFKAQNGYLSFPVESAGYIARSGTYFAFRSPNYDFVMDTASINYARNLSRPGVTSPVYLTGRRSQDCLQLYAFRLEPAHPESPRADVEVIPGIGIISDRTGHNGSEMEQNIYRLLKVNGISLDDYIYAACHNAAEPAGNTGSFITNLPPGANPNDAFQVDNPFTEPDKETYHTQLPVQGGNIPLVKCPIPPGYGYHIVQPGDSLGAIARLYNVNVQSLVQWNKLQNAQQIKVCDKIWVTPRTDSGTTPGGSASGYHTVQKGETLFGIARKYNTTVANIRHWNNLKNDEIQAGQQILVSGKPGGKPAGMGNPGANYTPGTPNTGPATTAPGPVLTTSGRLAYESRTGETLNSVAWKFGYSTPYLRHINRNNKNLPASDDDILPAGLILLVSDGKGNRDDLSSFVPPSSVQNDTYNAAGAANKNSQPGIANPPFNPPGIHHATFEFVGEYIVQSDDTLASIARRYGLSPEKLAAANKLQPGQQPAPRSILKIPK